MHGEGGKQGTFELCTTLPEGFITNAEENDAELLRKKRDIGPSSQVMHKT